MQQEGDRLSSAATLAAEGFYNFLKNCHRTQATQWQNGKVYTGILPEKVMKRVKAFVDHNCLLPMSFRLIHTVVLLEMNVEGLVTDASVIESLIQLVEELTKDSSWELLEPEMKANKDIVLLLTNFEVERLDAAAASYINLCFSKMQTRDIISHFPLTDESLRILSWTYRVLRKLCDVPIYEVGVFQNDAVVHLKEKIQLAVTLWMEKNLQLTRCQETIMQDVSALCDVLTKLKTLLLSSKHSASNFPVKSRDFDYFRFLAAAIDNVLSPVCEATLMEVDRYNEDHKQFHANMLSISGKCSEFYLLVKTITDILTDSIADHSCDNPLRLTDHPQWFEKILFILIDTACLESKQRVQRAVQLDTKDPGDCGNMKLTSSAIDVSSCFHKLASEWKQLGMPSDLQTTFLIRITNELCEDCTLYAQLMEEAAKEAPLAQLYLTVNNIEHVRQQVRQLPEILGWGAVSDADIQKSVLQRMLQNGDGDTCQLRDNVLQMVAGAVIADLQEDLQGWMDARNQVKNPDAVLSTLETSLFNFHSELVATMFPCAVTALWKLIVDHVAAGFKERMAPDYAEPIVQNLKTVEKYLQERWEVEPGDDVAIKETLTLLRLHATPTAQLQLDFYSELPDPKVWPSENIGSLAFKAGYKRTDKECVTMYVQVIKGQKLGITEKPDLRDLSLTVHLGPAPMFPSVGPQKVRKRKRELNPSFDETFVFPSLPSTVLNVKGASLLLWVRTSDYSGEVVFPLTSVSDMSKLISIDFLPATVVPLKRFPATPTYQVLKQRSKWDRGAEQFITLRRKISSQSSEFDGLSLVRGLKSSLPIFQSWSH